jgi:hypothetical protein
MSFTNIINTAGNIQGTLGAVQNFASSVLSMFGVDVVGVFDNTAYTQLFQSARPMKANVNRQLKIMDHPIESGAIISDFAIVLPVEIELSMLLTGDEYADMYKSILAYFETQTLVSVQLKSYTFANMLIQAMPHEETPEMFDVVPVALKLREVQLVQVQYQALSSSNVQDTTDQSTTQRGTQQPQAASSSLLYQGLQIVKGWL